MGTLVSDITKNKICVVCKLRELTDQESKIGSKNQCWYCAADAARQLGLSLPDEKMYGREAEVTDDIKQKILNPAPVNKQPQPQPGPQISASIYGQNATQQAPQPGPSISITDDTEIVVHGAGDETFIKFACKGKIPLQYEKHFERILKDILMIFGQTIKFGPQFPSTAAELSKISGQSFIGGS